MGRWDRIPVTTVSAPNCDLGRYGRASGIRKLDVNGSKLLVSKTFGGGGGAAGIWIYDSALGVAVDTSDSVWVIGSAESTAVPTTANGLQPRKPPIPASNGVGFGYAVKSASGGDLLYGTYLAERPLPGVDLTSTVALDGGGRPYFALNTSNSTAGAATVMMLTPDGSNLLASAEFDTRVQQIAVDASGGLYLAGTTSRVGFLTTPGSYQPLYPGFASGFLFVGPSVGYTAKLDLTLPSPVARFSSVVNAASRIAGHNPSYPEGAVAPGEIVTLVGSDFPSNPIVTFDGRPAPILYADANQINAVVPFEVNPPSTVVSLEGARGFVLPVFPAVPGLFTAGLSGRGQLAAVNEDGTTNSSDNPAKVGSVIRMFATGAGAMAPPIGDGATGPLDPPFPVPILGASAAINREAAPVTFVRQAPGLIAGVVQLDVQIPAGTASGDAAVVVYVGDFQSQTATTISVQ